MITWLYCQCGEEDMVMPYFLRWYAGEVDRLIFFDGGMSDTTRRIIQECSNAEIQECPYTPDKFDDLLYIGWLNTKYHEARGKADWAIIVDADEFLHTGQSLRKSLEEYQTQGIRAVQSIGLQMAADNFPVSNRQLPELVKIGAYDKIYDKTCVFDPTLWIRYAVGRHVCTISDYQQVKTGMKLLHYRYFGEDYMKRRNARNYARKSIWDKEAGRGYHVAPDYNEGRYSVPWYQAILAAGQEVI